MRRVIYGCAMSLDGYIAGPNGEHDWIVMDPDIDFSAMMARFDTFLIGRKTFEAMTRMGSDAKSTADLKNVICSRTLRPSDYPDLTICAGAESAVRDLREQPGKEIAIFGGGELFQSLHAAGLVDGIEVGVIPVILGGGVPLIPSPSNRSNLRLRKQRTYEKSGSVGLEYDIVR